MLLINAATVARARKRFVEEGLEAAVNDRPRPGRQRKLDGKQEAHLVAVACSSPPEGHVNWTLHLMADKVVELEFAGSISLETVRQILKKTNSSRGGKKEWCIPKLSGESVARMEDVLDLYHQEYNPERPVVCFGESSKQLAGDVRPPVKAAPGRVGAMTPNTSETGPGTCSCSVNRRAGGGHVEVAGRRTAVDFAEQMKWLVDEAYPDATVIRLSWTISTPTSPARSTKRLHRPGRAA